DDRNLHGVLDRSNPFPAGLSAVTLLASAGVQSYGGESAVLRHLREIDVHDLFVAPSGAELDREWNADRGTDRLEDVANQRQVAEQPRTSVALNNFLGGTTEVEVYEIEAEVLHHACRVGQGCGIAAEQLR